ncbi:MAG: S1 domain-containing RNA-binding protein, partial [Paenisporosarcina sp.]
TGITNFGAFVELPGGSTGLVHISEVADNYVKDINEHLKVGDMVEVKVMNVEADGKIGLSIRKAKPQAERPERPQRPRQNSRPNDRDRPFKENFEQKMARFLKDSEDRLSTLKRATESKRGGRGAKRG